MVNLGSVQEMERSVKQARIVDRVTHASLQWWRRDADRAQESSIGLSFDRQESHTRCARDLAATSGMRRRIVEKEQRSVREEGQRGISTLTDEQTTWRSSRVMGPGALLGAQ